MKPLGQKPKKYNFTDCHPPKEYENWWEHLCDENKTAYRQQAKKEIFSELQGEDN